MVKQIMICLAIGAFVELSVDFSATALQTLPRVSTLNLSAGLRTPAAADVERLNYNFLPKDLS